MLAASTCHIESTSGTVAFQVTRYDNKIYRWACRHSLQGKIVLKQQIKSSSRSHDVDTTVLFDKALTFCSCYVHARCRSSDYLLVWAHCKETCSTDAAVSLFSLSSHHLQAMLSPAWPQHVQYLQYLTSHERLYCTTLFLFAGARVNVLHSSPL